MFIERKGKINFAVGLMISFILVSCSNEPTEDTLETAKSAQTQPMPSGKATRREPPKQTGPMKATTKHTGKIVYKPIEGGFYAFEDKNGKQFVFTNLEYKYRKDGLVVEVEGRVLRDMETLTQYGTPFELDKITVLDRSQITNSEDM